MSALLPILLIGVVMWRAPKARQHPNQRPLVLGFALLAVVTTVRAPQVEAFLREADLVMLLTVPKHVAGVLMTAAILEFVARMIGHSQPRAHRARHTFTAVIVGIMLAVLPFVPRAADGDFALGAGGTAPALIYWAAWLTHLGTMLALASKMFFGQSRRAAGQRRARRLQLGLALSGTGTSIGLLYVLNKTALMIGTSPWGPGPPLSPDTTDLVNTRLMEAALLLVIIGTTLPARFVGTLLDKTRDLRALAELHSLWRDISAHNPDVVLAREPVSTLDTRLRLHRYAVEIEDGLLALCPHFQSGVRELAGETYVGPSVGIQAFIHACEVRVALRAKAAGVPEADHHEDHPTVQGVGEPGGDWWREEVDRLRAVACAYRSRSARRLALSFPLPTTELQESVKP